MIGIDKMVKIHPDILTSCEINQILSWLQDRPYTKSLDRGTPHGKQLIYRNKNLDLHLPDSLVAQILGPKIYRLFGELYPEYSAFLEGHYPFTLHVDSPEAFLNRNIEQTKKTGIHGTQTSLLISLNEHPAFKTAFFDHHVKDYHNNQPYQGAQVPVSFGDHNFDHFTQHDADFLTSNDVTLSDVYHWRAGWAVSWPRDQLHCSTNYHGTGAVKKALTLFF